MTEYIKKLKSLGCDVEGALERCGDDEEFYENCVSSLLFDEQFSMLHEGLLKGDLREAFEAAHSLKGVFANFGITPLLDIVSLVVEPLRKGEIHPGLIDIYEELISQRDIIAEELN